MEGLRVVGEGLAKGRLSSRLVLEDLLLVSLGIRRAALVTVPAELPDGDVLGAKVDFEFRGRVSGVGSDLRARLADTIERRRKDPIAFKIHVLTSSFANNVLSSESYKEHRKAARALGLQVQESEVRPSIREWYISRPQARLDLSDLLHRRHEIQKDARRSFKPGGPVGYYVYPEERDPAHLRALGELLGYPACCIEAYVAGRLAGDGLTEDMPEKRAARQARDFKGKPEAYWVKDFYPCRPDCPEAAARGSKARAALVSADPEFGPAYDALRRENLERVKAGPEFARLPGGPR